MDTDRAQRESVNAPGWRWTPAQGAYLWWDGERYTTRADWSGAQWHLAPVQSTVPGERDLPPASPGARALMSVLVFAGCAVLFWGGYVFGHNPASNYPRAMRDYYCADENIGKVTDGLWEPWFVLLALGLAGLVTWRQHGPRDRWLKVSAILGMIAIVVACPVTVWFTQVADCGM